MKVAIQGIRGSFHHQAVKEYFDADDLEILGKSTFSAVFESVKNNEADFGCIAIENSIYGSIYENYDLIKKYNFPIIGEIFLKINHNLLALPGTEIKDIKKILSHPVALRQCEQFLSGYDFHIEEYEDTAAAAELIQKEGMNDTAAIASSIAADMFNLSVLEQAIQDHTNNYTRFLIFTKNNITQAFDKVSLNIRIINKPGSLLDTLEVIRDAGGDMTKIESRPILGEVWQYQFYIDVLIDEDSFATMITHLKQLSEELNILGTYKRGEFVG